MAKDNLFASDQCMKTFSFNDSVAHVFDDMLHRSVPFYTQTLTQIAQLMCVKPVVYDLGCSLGGLIPYIKAHHPQFRYVGVDSSPSMLKKASQHASDAIQFLQADIASAFPIHQPTDIVCNLVLQFIPLESRYQCLSYLMDALPKGGQLFVVEKVIQEDPDLQQRYTQYYHAMKRKNGYNDQEIINKDLALQSVLVSKPVSYYMNHLHALGCQTVDVFFKWYNFVGILAVKA